MMNNPGFASNIFKCIRQEAGQNALKLARSLEKSTFKLEAHHRHLHFTHRALENRWFPNSLRFKAPGNHPIFKCVMEHTSIHCMKARIAICHEQIRSTNRIIVENRKKLLTLISKESYYHLTEFLKHRAKTIKDKISARHEKKLHNLNDECTPTITSEPKKWIVNLSRTVHFRERPKICPVSNSLQEYCCRDRSCDY